MTQLPAKFRKKPVVIEAMSFDGSRQSAKACTDWIQSEQKDSMLKPATHELMFGGTVQILIQTLEGVMIANEGDWVIKGVQGEFYPCKPHIFDKTYEPAE